jgi:hypothetical protein
MQQGENPWQEGIDNTEEFATDLKAARVQLPDMYDMAYYDYDELTPEEAHEMRVRWLKAYLEHFEHYRTVPLLTLPDNEQEGTFRQFGPDELVPKFLKYAAKNTALVIGILGILRVIKYYVMGDKTEPPTLSFTQQSPRPHKQTTTAKPRRKFTTGRMYAQGQSNEGAYLRIDERMINVTPIRNKTILTYLHSFETKEGIIPDGEIISYIVNGKAHEFAFDRGALVMCEADDIAIYHLPATLKINSAPDLVKKFWTREEAASFTKGSGMIDCDGVQRFITIVKTFNRSYANPTRNTRRTLENCLQYICPTRKGDCGRLITGNSQSTAGKFMGMHVAGGNNGTDNYGLAVMLTKEDLDEAVGYSFDQDTEISFTQEGPDRYDGPNLEKVETISCTERIFINRKSKFKRSAISDSLPYQPTKHEPILTHTDPRAKGIDPVTNMINDGLQTIQPIVHDGAYETALEGLRHEYMTFLDFPIGLRELTFEEALAGIPGLLCSYKTKTSAGFPLCKMARRKGKQDFYRFDKNGELEYEEWFKYAVYERTRELENENPSFDRFIVYLKDELVSAKKIEQVRTRLIYCGNLISNIAFRMKFGSLIIAMNKCYPNFPSAIGMNQYSYDMQLIYDYLTEVGNNFVAGDFKNFDKNMVNRFQRDVYELLMDLCPWADATFKENFINLQMNSPIQYEDNLIYYKSSHFSGCFFTTIVNNLVHEFYLRYVFALRHPDKMFKDHVRMKVLGDDHIYCFSNETLDMNPLVIADELAKINQTYTSDVKDAPLTDEFRAFEDITFLGAHPRLLAGQYTGALKKETILNNPHWTRNNNLTIDDELRTMIEMASQWDKIFYANFVDMIQTALVAAGREKLELGSQRELAMVVAHRTAASGGNFLRFESQGPEKSIVQLGEQASIESKEIATSSNTMYMMEKATQDVAASLTFGTDSDVYRDSFSWTSAQTSGTMIYSVDLPFGLLSKGGTENAQNMPFDRFTYWNGDVELIFQAAGTKFQQGLLAIYFMPLTKQQTELANITTNQYVFMSPKENMTTHFKVPYRYPRAMMNTTARDTESLGTVFVTVLSPLKSVESNSLTITMYSKYPDSIFKIPRPVSIQRTQRIFYPVQGGPDISEIQRIEEFEGPFEEQGAGQSTTINQTYQNVGGTMPISGNQNSAAPKLENTVSTDAMMPMPLDNPPLASGSLPVHQVFSGMAASFGVRPTVDMQLFPSALSRQATSIFQNEETKLENIMAKQCLLRVIKVTTSEGANELLYQFDLNTRFSLAEGKGIPLNIALLNQFYFWRADIELTFEVVKTAFHALRLQTVVAYGTPAIVEASRTVNYSKISDFTGESSVDKILVPFNSQTEFLRTYEGEDATELNQNYSLGKVGLYLANKLTAPDNVADAVEILVFIRFLNIKITEPRHLSPFFFSNIGKPVLEDYSVSVDSGLKIATVEPNLFIVPKKSVIITGTPLDDTYVLDKKYTYTFEVTRSGSFYRLEGYVNQITLSGDNITFKGAIQFKAGDTNGVLLFYPQTMYFTSSPTDFEFEAQGPDDNREDTPAEEIEELPPVEVTETGSSRPNIPCKLEIGEKFEFTLTDIAEIGRRYVRVTPGDTLPSYVKFQGKTIDYLNFPTSPIGYLTTMFAAWSGSLKYRIFKKVTQNLNIVYSPFIFNTGKPLPISVIDAIRDHTFVGAGATITTANNFAGFMARERLYAVNADNSYIDVSAPFQTHFNFLLTSNDDLVLPAYSGTMTFSVDKDEDVEIFSCFGDDLRLGIFRAPFAISFNLKKFSNGIAGFY